MLPVCIQAYALSGIKMDRKEIGYECVGWSHLVQKEPLASLCEHGYEPSCSIKCGRYLDQLSYHKSVRRENASFYSWLAFTTLGLNVTIHYELLELVYASRRRYEIEKIKQIK
jgi:hypothetical protein